MQPLVYYVATSIDGIIEPEGGGFDAYSTNEALIADYLGRLHELGSVVMGRRTYDIGFRSGVIDPYPWLHTYVASRTLADVGASNVTVVRDDVVGFVRSLRQETGKGIYLAGGGNLTAQLIAAGLVDELVVKVSPVLLGSGTRLCDRLEDAVRFDHVDTKRYDDGALLVRYRVKR